jgi:FkbM family methyltransferase
MTDRDQVWEQVRREHPEFTEACDIGNNHHAVREIVLGGSLTWLKAHSYFQPAPGTHVMDVGANAGIYSAYCAVNGADVEAFEPGRENFELLTHMIDAADLHTKIRGIKAAIMGKSGPTKYVAHGFVKDETIYYNGGLLTAGVKWSETDLAKAEDVHAISFDAAIGDQEWDCVKMDIEGAEAEVLLTAHASSLAQIKFMYVEIHDWMGMELYTEMVERMGNLFQLDGYLNPKHGIWEALYLTRRT